jgi:pyruvate kinase
MIPPQLTCTYEPLIDDLRPNDRVLLADGTVSLRVMEQNATAGRVLCEVLQPGLIRSRQGVNLPGVALSTPSLTDKDRLDLQWALDHGIDYIGLSFVRRVDDLKLLRQVISQHPTKTPPWIVAKIEKAEAIADLEAIIAEADAVMVARGDLGVETDIYRVPGLQKRIIRLCNEHRTPVITATQMLDSMQKNELPTRAEASDVFNAVLDGTDAVMLSGETAAGDYPVEAVAMMSRIVRTTTDSDRPPQFASQPGHCHHRSCDSRGSHRRQSPGCRRDRRCDGGWQNRHGDLEAASPRANYRADRPPRSGSPDVPVLGCRPRRNSGCGLGTEGIAGVRD